MKDISLKDLQDQFVAELKEVDDVAQIVLKGHLVIEGLMNDALNTYLLHGECLDGARLNFSQKTALCRAMSLDEHKNSMWAMIEKLNAVRNALAHSLDPERRAKALAAPKADYEREFPRAPVSDIDEMEADAALCMLAVSGCLGFLHGFYAEIRRFKVLVVGLDAVMNKGVL
ncbi:MAG: hypothetical protein ACOZAA_01590 [Pseudomonadota bacterium]